MLEGVDKIGTATWREQLSTVGHGRSGEQCERAAEYWFINPGMSKQYACMEHMWRRLGSARLLMIEIPYGNLEAGEKERCGQIKQGGLGHEKEVGEGKAGSSGGDNMDGDYGSDGMGLLVVAEQGMVRAQIKQKQRKGQVI